MATTSFSIKRFKDTYIVSNEDTTSLNGVLEIKSEGCTTYELIKSDIAILPGETAIVKLPYDGQYRLTLTDGVGGVDEIFIPHYATLLQTIVHDTGYILCDCAPNSDCAECGYDTEHVKQLSLLLKIIAYQQLTHPQHAMFLDAVFELVECSVNELSNLLVAEEQTKGEGDYVSLLQKILSFYYLAFYHSELKQSSLEETEYINTKFDYETISACIDAQLIIDVQNKIDNMATFTIQSGAYVNLPPVSQDNTINPANRVTTVLNMTMFPYTEPEGDPIDAMLIVSINANNQGQYLFDNVPITVNQIIPKTAIDEGRFVHVGADVDTVVNDQFDYMLRDTVSMQWG